jgi:hypothetical protein
VRLNYQDLLDSNKPGHELTDPAALRAVLPEGAAMLACRWSGNTMSGTFVNWAIVVVVDEEMPIAKWREYRESVKALLQMSDGGVVVEPKVVRRKLEATFMNEWDREFSGRDKRIGSFAEVQSRLTGWETR